MIYESLFPNNERADTARVVSRLAQAIERGEPCSMISMADGESATLWAAKGFGEFHYLSAWGFAAEDRPGVAEQLIAALSRVDIVGLPRSGPEAAKPGMGPKLREALRLWDVRFKLGALLADALVPFYLLFDGWLWMLLENRKVLVVTNEAERVAAALKLNTPPIGDLTTYSAGFWHVADATPITLEEGLAGSVKCLEQAANLPWKPDICILGAGARAAHLCVEIADMYSIPVIELGCVMSLLHTPTNELVTQFKWYEAGG